jgi:hypothetical protein
MTPIRRTVATTLVAGILFLGACQQASPPSPAASTASSAPPAASAPAKNAAAETVAIKAADGSSAVEVTTGGGSMVLVVTDNGRATEIRPAEKGGARTYQLASGAVEVKPSDSGFKLRRAGGALLWKVKIDDDKIKVSNNEENRDPWVLKTKYVDKAKILDPREAEIGEVKFYDDRAKAKVKNGAGADLFESDTKRHTAAIGVLMMKDVPREHQAVIVAELLARGK